MSVSYGVAMMAVDGLWALLRLCRFGPLVVRVIRRRLFTILVACAAFCCCSDEDDAKLQEELAEGYLRFLQAKDEHKRMDGTRLAKRTKKAKVRYEY